MLKGQIFSCIVDDLEFHIKIAHEGLSFVILETRNLESNFNFRVSKKYLEIKDSKIIGIATYVKRMILHYWNFKRDLRC